jgi:hypothetical protein
MSQPFGTSPARIATIALALSMLGTPGCRCSGGVSGSIDDAGFSLGTPPSSAPVAPRECGGQPCCGDPPEPCGQWLAKQRDGGMPPPAPSPSG